MAAKVKVIKTQNEFNLLTSETTLGNKVGIIVFFNGANAAGWKAHLAELNDLAGDLFEQGSLIGVDVRFFGGIVEKFHGADGKAAVFTLKTIDNPKIVNSDVASIKKAL